MDTLSVDALSHIFVFVGAQANVEDRQSDIAALRFTSRRCRRIMNSPKTAAALGNLPQVSYLRLPDSIATLLTYSTLRCVDLALIYRGCTTYLNPPQRGAPLVYRRVAAHLNSEEVAHLTTKVVRGAELEALLSTPPADFGQSIRAWVAGGTLREGTFAIRTCPPQHLQTVVENFPYDYDQARGLLAKAIQNDMPIVIGQILDRFPGLVHGNSRHIAAAHGSIATITALLDRGARMDASPLYQDPPLWVAARVHRLDIVRFLLSRGASAVSNVQDSLMLLAARTGDLPLAQLMMELEPELRNRPDGEGRPPLRLAIANRHGALATYLEQQGATLPAPELRDEYHNEPLMYLSFGDMEGYPEPPSAIRPLVNRRRLKRRRLTSSNR